MLKAPVPRPETVAKRIADDDTAEDWSAARLTAAQAQALREGDPSVSPWRVVAAQAVVGGAVAALAWWASGRSEVAASALYGAGVVVVPAALMARGMTSRLSRVSPVASAVSVMVWVSVKLATAVLLLMLAPRIVQPLSWPALLVGLVLCLQVYWFALLWRGHSAKFESGRGSHGS